MEISRSYSLFLNEPKEYNKNGISAFFYFLYLENLKELEKEKLLYIIYKHFNDYPNYYFIFALLLNIKFLYDKTSEDYGTFLYLMARLYSKASHEKKGIIEVVLSYEDLERMKSLEIID